MRHTRLLFSVQLKGKLSKYYINRSDTLFRTYLEQQFYSLTAGPNHDVYGVQLDPRCEFPEYELGWLCFSGRKHDKFTESDELVAIIYDPTYNGFRDLDPDQALLVEGVVVKTREEVDLGIDVDDPDYAESETEDFLAGEVASLSGSESSEEMEVDPNVDALADEIASLSLPDVLPPPIISNVTHLAAYTVEITGSTLGLVSTVTVDGRQVSFKIKSNTRLEVQFPPEVSGSVVLTTQSFGGTSNAFQYDHPAVATIAALNPNNGPRWGETQS